MNGVGGDKAGRGLVELGSTGGAACCLVLVAKGFSLEPVLFLGDFCQY